jgi:hypothetical protein
MTKRRLDVQAEIRREVLKELGTEWRSQGRLPPDGAISAIIHHYGPLSQRDIGLLIPGGGAQYRQAAAEDAFLREARRQLGDDGIRGLKDLIEPDFDAGQYIG